VEKKDVPGKGGAAEQAGLLPGDSILSAEDGLDDLDEMVKGNLEARRRQLPHAERIIKEELTEFQQWLAEVDLRPTVAEFKAYLEELKDKAGKAVTDAKVQVIASMPAMPGGGMGGMEGMY